MRVEKSLRAFLPFAFCLLPFIILATLNSAGYRYGASDQAFYVPSVIQHLRPDAFPRDAPLLDAQAHLTTMDECVAALARVTRLPLPSLLFALYLASLALLLFAALRLGAVLYRSPWTPVALAVALTLRHAVAKTGANTLEGYFHPRITAFAFGLLAVAMFLERRDRLVPLLLLGAALMHPTTTLWFGIWLAGAAWMAQPAWRRPMLYGAAAVAAFAIWVVWAGPLAGRLTRMDPEWFAVIESKDYLFPLDWPANVWLTNLIAIPAIVVFWRRRAAHGLTVARESAMVLGALLLVVVFACWLPFDAAHVALAIQLQTGRLFWMLDVLGTVYLVWALAEGTVPSRVRTAVVLALLLVASTGRGLYNRFVQFPNRPMFSVELEEGDWKTAMTWARQATPPSSGWLADPFHAAWYGSSVRVAAERDVLQEEIKDAAIAMYDRSVAMRVADRQRALAALKWDTPEGARALARRYDLDYLVVNHPVALPEAFHAGTLFIYRLR